MAWLKTFDGIRLYHEESGKGPPVVFVHESSADIRQWRGQVEALSADYRCIAYNARGYPPSEVPDRDADFGYEAHWRDVGSVIEQLVDGPAHVVGLSMGSYAALVLGLERPDLVRSLLLAGCGTGSTREVNTRMPKAMEALAQLFLDKGSAAGADAIAAGPSRTGFRRRDPAGWQAWRDDLASHSATGMARTFRNYQGGRPSLYAFEDRIRQLERPVMLVIGDEDEGCLDVNLDLKRWLPQSSLWIAAKSGHAVNLEAPRAFNHVLRGFLAGVESREAAAA